MGKVKKILAGVLVVVIAGSGITAGLMQLKKNSQKTVAVTPVSGLLQEFYTPSTTLDGTITSSATQTINGDKDLIIDQIYVTKGDAVKKGDPLVSFDTRAGMVNWIYNTGTWMPDFFCTLQEHDGTAYQ